MGSVDLVYLWCDGQDPQFVEAKKLLLTEDMDEDCVGEIRYIDNDELRYSLRSVYEFLPWINHIYIVTNNQRPKWLLNHPKISVVDHKEFIPEALLPTFNSVTIEMYLDRIPNLSEKFLYANDDIFFNSYLQPADFFKGDVPLVRFGCKFDKVLSSIEEAKKFLKEENSAYRKTLVRAWLTICKKYGEVFEFFLPTHSIDAFTKSLFRQVLKNYPELLSVNSSKLRTGEEIQRVLFQFEMAYKLGCPYEAERRATVFKRVMQWLSNKQTYSLYLSDMKKAQRCIPRYNPQTFCLNNIQGCDEGALKNFLTQKFPRPAPWEIISEERNGKDCESLSHEFKKIL